MFIGFSHLTTRCQKAQQKHRIRNKDYYFFFSQSQEKACSFILNSISIPPIFQNVFSYNRKHPLFFSEGPERKKKLTRLWRFCWIEQTNFLFSFSKVKNFKGEEHTLKSTWGKCNLITRCKHVLNKKQTKSKRVIPTFCCFCFFVVHYYYFGNLYKFQTLWKTREQKSFNLRFNLFFF